MRDHPVWLTWFSGTGIVPASMAEAEAKQRFGPLMWWGIALLTIVLGYVDLARGGMTIAPILLVVGYCVLVPLAILRS